MGQQQNPVNEASKKGVRSSSRFKPNYSLYQTMRFGEISPSFAMECVDKDHIMLRTAKDIDTYTLKAPLMTAVRHVSAYAAVPMRAILPNSAELIITNPLVGDDVIAENVNCGVPYQYLVNWLLTLFNDWVTLLNKTDPTRADFDRMIWLYQTLSLFLSQGSVLANSGINLNGLFRILDGTPSHLSFDQLCERFLDQLNAAVFNGNDLFISVYEYILGGTPDSESGSVGNVFLDVSANFQGDYTGNYIDFRRFVELLRDGYLIELSSLSSDFVGYFEGRAVFDEVDAVTVFLNGTAGNPDYPSEEFLNLSRLVAYQIICADFFSNDKVDSIYSAQLYRDNQMSLLIKAGMTDAQRQYSLNGIQHYYDAVSSVCIQWVLSYLYANYPNTYSVAFLSAHNYLHNIMDFQRSLRYGDYFAGAKTSPLAVGDVNVPVDSLSMEVDVVDVTKKIQVQRFLNAVNRAGRKFKDYMAEIFGAAPQQDMHEPIWIGDFTDIIGAEEVDNTGVDQLKLSQTKTSNLRSNTRNYAFDINVREPLWIIGVDYFDVPRAYDMGIDRNCLHADRYEMFNPFMQYIGDQPVEGIEIDPSATGFPFGYQLRYVEYKERVDRCAGGFRDFLPGYAVILDRRFIHPLDPTFVNPRISSDFIRAHASEFDALYVSLTNWTMAGYFHFIVRSDFSVDADRPMSFAPSIL